MRAPPFNLQAFYEAERNEHCRVAEATFKELFPVFSEWVEVSAHALQQGKKLFFFGNGGSAADAQHLAAEFTVRMKETRRALAALALTTDTSTLTAIGNDFGFDHLFSRQIEALGQEGDVAIGISTSGKSPNVLRAFEVARQKGLITVGLTGGNSGDFPPLVDILLTVPSYTTARIQEMHITLGQILCGALEYRLGLVDLSKPHLHLLA
ncbi:MAG: D-sedoheptulose 7-phosphate isomerase [Proteobacteria bacterium]|nr:D-sedoheptulose 7-phosphate isomerase [Pseudomonadota bacterium]